MTRKLMTLTILSAALSATTAFAMTEMDANGDGMLTIDEVQAVYPEVTETQFTEADSDANGVIDETELVEARDAGLIP